MTRTGTNLWCAIIVTMLLGSAHAAVTPELQHAIRENTFEVVMKKPDKDQVAYEKPLPLDLLPYIERTDLYQSVGTAFALGHNTYVTAGHVIVAGVGSQYGAPALRRADGAVFEIDRIIKFSAHEDYVVFSLRNDPAPAGFEVNRSATLDEPVLAIGNALGEGIVIRDGLYTSETPEQQDGRWKWIRFSAAASPGNSGGPLCDATGKVIGIVIGKSPNENLNYSLPIARVLDDVEHKARFDQRMLVEVPFLHGTQTYNYKDEFPLPLTWPAFSEGFLKVTNRHFDASRAQLLKAYADTWFPKGPGTADILFEPDANGDRPRLIAQQADGTWTAYRPEFTSVELPADGSVEVANMLGIKIVHLVRSNNATDDEFYNDSKGFMDLALKGLDLRRPVGPDKVRVTSLGSAISDSVFLDAYGRKWQQRVWPVPFFDAYLIALQLPTPNGCDALIFYAPSSTLSNAKQMAQMFAPQFDTSYSGTLAQWQAMLHRRALLPRALEGITLSKDRGWTLQLPRFTSTVTPEMLPLDAKSPLLLTMGFMNDGQKVIWDVQEVWWEKDNRYVESVGVWRRARPPGDARLETRNRFDSVQARRTPYDGALSRDTAETYSASRILDAPGKKPGAISADLKYGLSLHLAGAKNPFELSQSLSNLAAATKIAETGYGDDAAGIATAASESDLDKYEREAMASVRGLDSYAGKDIRGVQMADELRALFKQMRDDAAARPAANHPPADSASKRLDWFRDYWREYPALSHNRELWTEFLRRNHLPEDTKHQQSVTLAESALLNSLRGGHESQDSGSLAHALTQAYVEERSSMAKATKSAGAITYTPRSSPCPAPATAVSGNHWPKMGSSSRSLDELWPAASKRLGEEGLVLIALKISSTGCVTSMAIVGSSGSDWLDNTVMTFMEGTTFIPGVENNQPIESSVSIPIVFKLTQ